MKLIPRIGALLGISALSLGVAAAGASSASAELIPDGVYSVSYTGDLFLVDSESDAVIQLSYADWQALGFPAPQRAQTDWVKYPWSPTVYAVTFFGDEREEWMWSDATFAEWQRAGFPHPRNAGWIPGSDYYKWGTSDELFVDSPDGVIHKLTYPQWADAGHPTPENVSNQGFIKYSWNPTIVYMDDLERGQGQAINYGQWRDEDFPTPRVVSRVTGDQVYQNYGSKDIWYAGPGLNKVLTFAEWRAMGSPAPEMRGTPPKPTTPTTPPKPAKPADKNCGDFPNRLAAQAEFDYWYPIHGDVFDLDRDRDRIVCEKYKY